MEGSVLKLGLATVVAVVAALSLAFVAAPCAPAMAMQTSGSAPHAMSMSDDAAAMPCDHGQAQSEKKSSDTPCKPGMACYAASAHVPVQTAAVEPIFHALAVVSLSSDTPLRSRPPDEALRPPKLL